MQVEIVGLRAFRARAGIEQTADYTERGQQLLTDLGRHLRLQCDQVLRRRGNVGLPQELVTRHLDRLQRNHQPVALLQEVPGKDVGHVQFAPRRLRIEVVSDKLLCDRGRTNIQRPCVGEGVGDFISQREAQKLYADV